MIVKTQLIDGDMVLDIGDRVLVASKSTPGDWYTILDTQPVYCACEGNYRRGRCRHIVVAQKARDERHARNMRALQSPVARGFVR